jgi:hypothetical protein
VDNCWVQLAGKSEHVGVPVTFGNHLKTTVLEAKTQKTCSCTNFGYPLEVSEIYVGPRENNCVFRRMKIQLGTFSDELGIDDQGNRHSLRKIPKKPHKTSLQGSSNAVLLSYWIMNGYFTKESHDTFIEHGRFQKTGIHGKHKSNRGWSEQAH